MKYGTGIIAQVVTGYETLALTIAEIAEQLDLNQDEVTYLLTEHSPTYKQELRNIKGGAAPSRYEELLHSYETLAKYSDNEHVREKALRFLIDEEKGRNDVGLKLCALKERALTQGVSQEDRLKKFNQAIQINISNPIAAPSNGQQLIKAELTALEAEEVA